MPERSGPFQAAPPAGLVFEDDGDGPEASLGQHRQRFGLGDASRRSLHQPEIGNHRLGRMGCAIARIARPILAALGHPEARHVAPAHVCGKHAIAAGDAVERDSAFFCFMRMQPCESMLPRRR